MGMMIKFFQLCHRREQETTILRKYVITYLLLPSKIAAFAYLRTVKVYCQPEDALLDGALYIIAVIYIRTHKS